MTAGARRATGPVQAEMAVALLRIDRRLAEAAEKSLHPRERRILGKVGPARRREWLCVRGAIKRAARRCWPDLRPEQILTARGPSGPPCALAPDGRSLGVSAAHAGGYVLAAVSKSLALGVDIQTPDARCLRLARRFFPPAGRSVRSATAWWVALEASAKCTGLPLGRLLKSAALGGRGRLRTLAWPGGRLEGVKIFSCRGLLGALALSPHKKTSGT